jgi:hypothetical protein
MRLVIQCSVCGTIHTVGTAVCGTCRASGIRDLRLLFECQICFRLGLGPSCDVCSPVIPSAEWEDDGILPPLEATLEERPPREEILEAVLEKESGAEGTPEIEELPELPGLDDESEFDLSIEGLPLAELDEEELRLDEEDDSRFEEG